MREEGPIHWNSSTVILAFHELVVLTTMIAARLRWIDTILVEEPDKGLGAVGLVIGIAANSHTSDLGDSHDGMGWMCKCKSRDVQKRKYWLVLGVRGTLLQWIWDKLNVQLDNERGRERKEQ